MTLHAVPPCLTSLLVVLTALAAVPARAQPPAQGASPPDELALDATAVPPRRYSVEPALREGDRPLTVAEAVAQALAGAPTLEEARASTRAADAAIREARAALWPRVQVEASYRRIDGFPDGVIDAGGGGQVVISIPRDQGSVSARLSVPLTDELFRALPLLRAAEAGRDVERHEAAAAAADVRLQAEEAYWRWVEARAAAAVAAAASEQAREQLGRVEALTRSGLATQADVLAARSRAAQAAETEALAAGAFEVASRTLVVVARLELDPGRYAVASAFDAAPAAPREPTQTLVDRALAERAELQAVEAALRAQGRRVDAARAAAYPRIEAFAGAQVANPNLNIIPPTARWEDSWEAGVALRWSPNDLGGGLAARDRESAERAALEARRDALRDAVRLEVERAVADWRASESSLAAARVREEAAEEAYAARRAQLAAGEVITTELLDADLELTSARLAAIRATAAQHVAAAATERALGGPVAP